MNLSAKYIECFYFADRFMNFRIIFLFLILCSGFFKSSLYSSPNIEADLNAVHKLVAPFLLPDDHPVKDTLDYLFAQSRVIENEKSLLDAGFEIIAKMQVSFVIVARHYAVPGYVFKIYLDSETRTKKGIPNWKWLFSRCRGAQRIRKVIKDKKLRYFSVPDKWLYALPQFPLSRESYSQPLILIETDMEIESDEVTKQSWLTVKPEQLDELYEVVKHGYGSFHLVQNVPYTKNGKFAFVDTEYPRRILKLRKIKKYLSPDMQKYWDTLIQDHSK